MNLSRNLWFVKGASKGMVYNFNNCCLYRMPLQTFDYIKSLQISSDSLHGNNLEQSQFLNYLCQESFFADKTEEDIISRYSISEVISFAWIEITQKCNLNCVHCYEKDKNSIFMSFHDFCNLVNQLCHNGIKRIQITGGEPTIHPGLLKMMDYCHGKFEFVELYTNATLISERILDSCRKNNIQIAYSQVAQGKEAYEQITRTKGSYQQYLKGVDAISHAEIPYRIGAVQADNTNSSPTDMIDRADFPRLTGNATLDLYTDEMLRKKLITQKTFSQKFKPEFVVLAASQNQCFCSNIYVDVLLDIYPCPMERRLKHGNIRGNDLKEILKSDIINLTKDKVEDCQACEYRYACFDCRPDSNGAGVLSKPWYCTYDPQVGIWKNVDEFIHNLRKENAQCLKSKR